MRRGGVPPGQGPDGVGGAGGAAGLDAQVKARQVTGGPAATVAQEPPASSDRYTRPAKVPRAARSPSAARQNVSTLPGKLLGRPIDVRRNGPPPCSGRR